MALLESLQAIGEQFLNALKGIGPGLHGIQERLRMQNTFFWAHQSIKNLSSFEGACVPAQLLRDLGGEQPYLNLLSTGVWKLLPPQVFALTIVPDKYSAYRYDVNRPLPPDLNKPEVWSLQKADEHLTNHAAQQGYRYKPVFPIDYMG